MWEGFLAPSDDARPRVWWHWMDGNVDPEGIRLDLEWLQRIGVRGVQMFSGGMGTPLVVPAEVAYGSPEWTRAVAHASRLAHELGLEFSTTTSAGWSAAGAPWVTARDAMKKIVWSETDVEGPGPVEVRLADLPDVAGPFQSLPSGAQSPDRRFAEQWAVVAVPLDGLAAALRPEHVEIVAGEDRRRATTDLRALDAAAGIVLDLSDRDGVPAIEYGFPAPVTVAALMLGLLAPRGFGAPPPPAVHLELLEGSAWRRVATVEPVERPAARGVPVRTVTFDAVTAERFRLVVEPGTGSALPTLAPGVRPPALPPIRPEVTVVQAALFSGVRVHEAELKAGFGAAPDYYALERPGRGSAIDPLDVIDVTSRVDESGVLRWQPPAGRWRILRFGASLTGATNGPAPAAATGLEVDKLDGDAVRRYLDEHLALFDGVAIDALLSDSIESGAQNVSVRWRERFRELRGYDCTPWLPALAGHPVGDSDRTDRFLFDHRRTIADLVSSEYYATVADVAHSRRALHYAEALEDNRPQLGGDLQMRRHADVPRGAMWVFDAGDEPDPTFVADLRGASSVAHVWGRSHTGAESMTALRRPWSDTPRRLKHVADLELALGVTRFCVHTSPHQPSQVAPPGIPLAPQLGQAFTRHDTWAGEAGPWIDYLARCSWILNQGVPAVDVAVFLGEEAPLTALFGAAPDRTLPPSISADYVDLEALEERMTAADGDLAAGDVRYRALVLGGSSERMTIRALTRIGELAREGVTVLGAPPACSPSLADDPAEFERLRDALWALPTVSAAAVLADAVRCALGPEDLALDRDDLPRLRRRVGDLDVLFVSNPHPRPVTVTGTSRRACRTVAWDPVALTRTTVLTGAGAASLDLAPAQSILLVSGEDALGDAIASGSGDEGVRHELDGRWTLDAPGRGTVAVDGAPLPWTGLGPAWTGFSGTAVYRTTFELAAVPETASLRFADVADLARIVVNGVDCGLL
nr:MULTISPECIES: glycosyl hydrolase [unclassified Rathayibacter]